MLFLHVVVSRMYPEVISVELLNKPFFNKKEGKGEYEKALQHKEKCENGVNFDDLDTHERCQTLVGEVNIKRNQQ